MFKRSVLAALLAASPCASAFAVETSSSAPQPFPAGYGYMEPSEIKALAEAVYTGNHTVVRDHGWKLWAGIMQPAQGVDWPIWYTWRNTYGAFAVNLTGELSATALSPSKSLIKRNLENLNPVNIPSAQLPVYPIPSEVQKLYPNATTKCGAGNICDGKTFLFNGDILIPTESLSTEGYDWLRDSGVYKQEELNTLYKKGVHELNAPQRYIVTKHMYWPVKADQISAIPVWRDDYPPQYSDYAGYEKWANLIAVDPSGRKIGQTVEATYLYGVLNPASPNQPSAPWPSVSAKAKVYGLDDFYFHKVTKADWDSFDEADKAIINASSYWAYNAPFGVGDYLVTIAMHVNTKEIPTWALQSVWWSDAPDAGPFAKDRPVLKEAKGPWKHYLLTDAYGIAERDGEQPVAMNPYIELVIHPVGTNCNNCHMRAGWPKADKDKFPQGASYQNPACPDLLATLHPDTQCLKDLTLTDFQWIIPDRAQ